MEYVRIANFFNMYSYNIAKFLHMYFDLSNKRVLQYMASKIFFRQSISSGYHVDSCPLHVFFYAYAESREVDSMNNASNDGHTSSFLCPFSVLSQLSQSFIFIQLYMYNDISTLLLNGQKQELQQLAPFP